MGNLCQDSWWGICAAVDNNVPWYFMIGSWSQVMLSVLPGITAVVYARILLWLVRDSEGPNIPVVLGLGAIIYVMSTIFCRYFFSRVCAHGKGVYGSSKNTCVRALQIGVQLLVTGALFFAFVY